MENKSHSTSDGERKLVQNSHKKEEDGPRKLPLKLLEEITNSFAKEQKLGSGAFGDVYKGVLDGEVIAVKKLRFIPYICDKQFENEFGHLSKLKHQNIVQLVGFCHETKEVLVPHEGQLVSAVEIHRVLCLEFMPHGCLGEFLSDQSLVHDWHVRFKIIKGICEGLNYLHKFSVTHLDLKPGNILLDEKMIPKIADFGLSRLMGEENTIITMSGLGTPGYMPPEFINNQIISTKYDIFSLGVILKRIMSGEMDYFSIAEMGNQECIEHVHNYWEKKLQKTPRYPSLEVDCKQVRRCIEIAVDCTKRNRLKRPTMEDIVRKLDKLEVKEDDSRSQIEQITMPPSVSGGDKNGGSNEILVQIKGNGNDGSGKEDAGGGGGNGNDGGKNRGGDGQPNNVKGGEGGAPVGGHHHPEEGKKGGGGGAAGLDTGVGGPMGGGMPLQQLALMRPNVMSDACFPGMGHPHMGGRAVQDMATGGMLGPGLYHDDGGGGDAGVEMLQAAAEAGNPMAQQLYMAMGHPHMGGRAVQDMATGGMLGPGLYHDDGGGGDAGVEMLQAAAAAGNPMAQQPYMAPILQQQQQQQQQQQTGGHGQGSAAGYPTMDYSDYVRSNPPHYHMSYVVVEENLESCSVM